MDPPQVLVRQRDLADDDCMQRAVPPGVASERKELLDQLAPTGDVSGRTAPLRVRRVAFIRIRPP